MLLVALVFAASVSALPPPPDWLIEGEEPTRAELAEHCGKCGPGTGAAVCFTTYCNDDGNIQKFVMMLGCSTAVKNHCGRCFPNSPCGGKPSGGGSSRLFVPLASSPHGAAAAAAQAPGLAPWAAAWEEVQVSDNATPPSYAGAFVFVAAAAAAVSLTTKRSGRVAAPQVSV